jgi:hypothetical protein
MEFENQKLRSVADVAARIMMGEKALHPNQQKLDVHEPEKDKLTADDFKKLRSMKKEETMHEESCDCGACPSDKDMKKEEVDLDEGKMGQLSADLKDLSHDDFHKEYGKPKSHYDPSNFKKPVQPGKEMDRARSLAQRAMASMKKEEVEELEEMFPGTPEYEKKYGKAPQDMKKGEKKKTTQGEMEKTGKGVVHRRKFSEMVESYTEGGVKGLFRVLAEEPTSAEFDAQLDDAKQRAAGTKKQPDVAKAAVQAVQNEQTHTTVEFIDYNDVNGVKYTEIDLEERKMSEPEMEKKEEIVKGMKKGLAGFKERYGKDAKSVMYATATKQAKGE